jgi:hypothetical protein
MKKRNDTTRQLVEQMDAHRIEFGKKYRDPASGFVGEVQALYFYKHGCLRVSLRGQHKTSGEPAEFTFDAPELVAVDTGVQVPAGKRSGGPHDLASPAGPTLGGRA